MTTLVTPQDIFQKDDLHAAIEKIQHMFPQQAKELGQKREQLITHILNTESLAEISPVDVKPEPIVLRGPASDAATNLLQKQLGACNFSLIKLSFNVVSFVCSFFGLKLKIKSKIIDRIGETLHKILEKAKKLKSKFDKFDAAAQKAIDEAEKVKKLTTLVQDFNQADGAKAKAKVLFTILVIISEIGVLALIFELIYDDLSWWDWVMIVVTLTAQVIAWIGTAGAAFIVLVADKILSALELTQDICNTVEICHCN